MITLLCCLLLPSAAPLISMLMLGNLMRESMCVDRLSDTAQNALMEHRHIFLGLSVGSKLSADKFLNFETLGILLLGLIAFSCGTAGGVWMGKLMCRLTGGKVNPMLGAAGVSAVPMAARVVNKLGTEEDPQNFLLMHAMGERLRRHRLDRCRRRSAAPSADLSATSADNSIHLGVPSLSRRARPFLQFQP